MSKKLLDVYTFDASAQTLTIFGLGSDLQLERVLLVTNVTDGIIIYNFADPAKGGSVSTNVLTLDFDTTGMSDTDSIQIFYDDSAADGNSLVALIAATPFALPTGAATEATLDSVKTGTDKIPASPSTAGKQDTGNASLTSLDGKVTAVNTGAVVVASSALPSGAASAALQTQPGVDIGDVTVNNASGAAAVNIQDGGNSITVDGTVAVSNLPATQPVSGTVTANAGSGTLAVSAAALPLPSGASTEATLAGIKTGTDKIPTTPASEHTAAASPHSTRLTDGTTFYKTTTPADTQPVSAASLPLPAGAATEAKQDTEIASLATISGNVTDIETKLPAFGILGFPSPDVLSIQGPSGALSIDGSVEVSNVVTVSVPAGTLSGSAASVATMIAATDVSLYDSYSIQLTGTWNATVTVEVSNDNTNWAPITDHYSIAAVSSAGVQTFTGGTNGIWYAALRGKFIRVRTSAWTSGTVTATLTLRTGSPISGTVVSVMPNGVAIQSAGSGSADGATNASIPHLSSRGYLYNEGAGTWDRARGNEDITYLTSTSRTTTQTSSDLLNYNGLSALIVTLNVTSAGTGSVTLSIQGKAVVSNTYFTILTGAAVTTNSQNVYRVGPFIPAVANLIAQDYLPRQFRILVTANNANAMTYSVGYTLVRH